MVEVDGRGGMLWAIMNEARRWFCSQLFFLKEVRAVEPAWFTTRHRHGSTSGTIGRRPSVLSKYLGMLSEASKLIGRLDRSVHNLT